MRATGCGSEVRLQSLPAQDRPVDKLCVRGARLPTVPVGSWRVEASRWSMNRFAQWVVAMTLVVSLGGHWALLQGLAWTTMLARFSQAMPLTEAVASTFDGKHPCPLCLAVQKGQQEEQKKSRLQPLQKLVLILDAQVLALIPPPPLPRCSHLVEALRSRAEEPPRPPPRMPRFATLASIQATVRGIATSRDSLCRAAGHPVTADHIADRICAAGDQFLRGCASELPRYDVPTYPDCEKRPCQGKSCT